MEIRRLVSEDVEAAWQINEHGLPGTGQVSQEELADLLSLCKLPLGVFDGNEMLGFVLCLAPRTRYASRNYAWFNERYQEFLYVDRIAVAIEHRGRGIGTQLYERVIEHAESLQFPVTAEVNLTPPNPGSIRFHERHSFTEVGVFSQGVKSVTMMFRPLK